MDTWEVDTDDRSGRNFTNPEHLFEDCNLAEQFLNKIRVSLDQGIWRMQENELLHVRCQLTTDEAKILVFIRLNTTFNEENVRVNWTLHRF
jgi:hypothetical protein